MIVCGAASQKATQQVNERGCVWVGVCTRSERTLQEGSTTGQRVMDRCVFFSRRVCCRSRSSNRSCNVGLGERGDRKVVASSEIDNRSVCSVSQCVLHLCCSIASAIHSRFVPVFACHTFVVLSTLSFSPCLTFPSVLRSERCGRGVSQRGATRSLTP